MVRLNELLLQCSNDHEKVEFLTFVRDEITTAQCKAAMKLASPDELIAYLLCCYGSYCIPKRGVPHLILNPEALLKSKPDVKTLADILKSAIVVHLDEAEARKPIKRPIATANK